MSKPKVNSTLVIAIQSGVIAVLITAAVAFIGGMHYANSKNDQMKAAVTQATAVAPAVEVKK